MENDTPDKASEAYNYEDAVRAIENVAGFTENDTGVGRAWEFVQNHIDALQADRDAIATENKVLAESNKECLAEVERLKSIKGIDWGVEVWQAYNAMPRHAATKDDPEGQRWGGVKMPYFTDCVTGYPCIYKADSIIWRDGNWSVHCRALTAPFSKSHPTRELAEQAAKGGG